MTLGAVLVPVSGSSSSIREMASSLADLCAAIGHLGAQLEDLRTMATWESSAGLRFDAALALMPTALDQVRHRYLAASQALDEFAGHHHQASIDTERQAIRHRAAHEDIVAIEAEITRAYADPDGATARSSWESEQRQAVARATAAEEAFNRAWRAFDAAAADCRQRLHAAARDGIVDTGSYTAASAARSLAQSLTTAFGIVALLPTPAKPFAAAAAGVGAGVVLGADVLILLGYGEGSWSDITERALWNAAGRGAATMSRAAGIGAVKGVNGRWTGAQVGTGDRLRAGRRELADDLAARRAALRSPATDRHLYAPIVGGTRAPMIGPRQPLPTRAQRILQTTVEAKITGINDRWRMAAAGGTNAVVLQASSVAITTAAKARAADQQVETVRERLPERAAAR